MVMAKKINRYQQPKAAKKRLRKLLLLFFIGLSLPLYFLFDRVYAQLENEVYYRQYNEAQVFVEQVDNRLLKLIDQEQARPIAEYSFFNVLESPLLQSTGIKFSPLSSLPPASDIPALTGYFQIDPDGSFRIPQLPTELNNQVVLSTKELANRIQLKNSLRELLAISDTHADSKPMAKTSPSVTGQRSVLSKQKSPTKQSYRFDDVLASVDNDSAKDKYDQLAKRGKARDNISTTVDNLEAVSEQVLGEMNIDSKRFVKKKQEVSTAFSRQRKLKAEVRKSNRREVVKLPKQSVVDDYLNQSQSSAASSAYPATEESFAMAEAEVTADSNEQMRVSESKRAKERTAVNIFSFESEVGPMQLLMLEQHLCFFRQVWYQNSRYVQGFIVDRNDFFNKLLIPLINGQQTANFSGVLLAYNGQIINHFNSGETDRTTLIYRSALTVPLQSLEVIINATVITAGVESVVVDSLAGLLVFIVVGGLLLFYRLGASQIDLVGRQRNFISAVSHELKTPLTSIRMYGEMLRSDWVIEEQKKRSYYDYIYFESERLSRLINNILQLAKLENSQEEITYQLVTPAVLLQRLSHQISLQIEASGFQLEVLASEAGDDLQIQVDEDAMTQVMINLVDNAIKFSSAAERKLIDIGFRCGSDKTVTFFVRDYGPGIAKKQMKKIFQLFYRSGDELTRTQPGTGIGLALVVQLTESMNAKVDLVNRDPGAEFQVKFKAKS